MWEGVCNSGSDNTSGDSVCVNQRDDSQSIEEDNGGITCNEEQETPMECEDQRKIKNEKVEEENM